MAATLSSSPRNEPPQDMATASSSSPPKEPPQDQNHDLQHQLQQKQQLSSPIIKDITLKTKTIQFLGRTTPIILQNDNGSCPLLAICNVLLLQNRLILSSDIGEVSQRELLSLVTDLLNCSNSNVNNKDAGYVENQRQNIADAIDLLPKLATGMNVNLRFMRINDFEFTPERAIFDLLEIPLCHGWIVDQQDHDTATAIGSKSYDALLEELVSLEIIPKSNPEEEDSVDFVAATTAALGVPSRSLSKTRCFDDSPCSVSDQVPRKGDLEEEEELSKALEISKVDFKSSISDPDLGHANGDGGEVSFGMDENMFDKQAVTGDSGVNFHESDISIPDDSTASSKDDNERSFSTSTFGEAANPFLKNDAVSGFHQPASLFPEESTERNEMVEKHKLDALVQNKSAAIHSVSVFESCADGTMGGEKVHNQPSLTSIDHETSDESGIIFHKSDASGAFPSTVDGSESEPMYEREESALDTKTGNFENREPVYEGEAVLQEQADKSSLDALDPRAKEEITPEQGELVNSFLRNNASQLTSYGLSCLQDGLEELQLCVFFRNNHFSTMFKFEGELYLLVTDQGYINQPDLVWEKLNEVNGDTLFMTGNFKEFKVESHENNTTWDENNVMTNTADYLASIESATHAGLDVNSDLQLAIALQQQEFEQQPPRQNQQTPSVSGTSRLVTGPQVPRSTGRNPPSSPKPDAKNKDKCTVM